MNRRLRILFLADGRSIHTKRWVGYFAQRHDVLLLSSPPLAGMTWDRPDIRLARGSEDSIIPKINSLRVWWYIQKLIRSFRPDLIHAHYLIPNAWLAAASGFRPFVTTTWGSDLLGVTGFALWLNRWATCRADLNTVDSNEAVEHLLKLHCDRDKIVLIQFGVDTDFFCPGPVVHNLRREWGIPDEAEIIVSPRILSPLYNGQTIAEAFCRLASERSKAYLVFLAYNADPQYQNHVKATLQTKGLLDRVRFVPGLAHQAMPDLYRTASAIVSVPSSDTTPVTLLEAMATGSPVIVSSLPSLHEWIHDRKNGWIVPPKNSAALFIALREALDQKVSERQGMSTANRQVVQERASQQAQMALMEAQYYRLVDRALKR